MLNLLDFYSYSLCKPSAIFDIRIVRCITACSITVVHFFSVIIIERRLLLPNELLLITFKISENKTTAPAHISVFRNQFLKTDSENNNVGFYY